MVQQYCHDVGNFITKLTQLEWFKSRLKRSSYDLSKISRFIFATKLISIFNSPFILSLLDGGHYFLRVQGLTREKQNLSVVIFMHTGMTGLLPLTLRVLMQS
jgi:hypothetical protein